uniref:UDP-N-acetylmuramoyl-tripeptide--D-alanyl-D-alanine ligase n=1 Tax=candidate division CPR3 bacterium TaxID=2268181 RepID=A0A7C4R5G2_UNCC3
MKRKLKGILRLFLKLCAIRLLNKFRPDIIAITGSIGKTSAKDAIYEVLSSKFNTRKNEGNFNNEIGVPLTIIGADSAKNIFDIIRKTYFSKNHPEKLVLEMGADRFGDLKYLTSFAKPKIAVVTRVACSHLEFFCDLEGVAKEKGTLVESLDKNGWAVLNYDDKRVRAMVKRIPRFTSGQASANVLTYGIEKGSDVLASKIKTTKDGLSFEIGYKKEKENIALPVFGKHHIYSILAAVCCGLIYNISLREIINNLKGYKSPKGRMNLIKGINQSLIVDDTYNANPESMVNAIETISEIKEFKKIFVLGDMLELGSDSCKKHQEVISKIFAEKYDKIYLVGEKMLEAYKLIGNKNNKNIKLFTNSLDAALDLKNNLNKNEMVLVKGSQGMRMEKLVEVIMAEPEMAEKLLCRQSEEWKKK